MRNIIGLFIFISTVLLSSSVLAKGQDTKEYIDTDGITYIRYVITKADIQAAKDTDINVIVMLFGENLATNIGRYNRFDIRYSWVGRRINVPKLASGVLYTPMPEYIEKLSKYPQYIIVDLKKQFLGAYEYGKLVKSHPISSGNPDSKEPDGSYKNRSTKPGLYKILAKDINHVSLDYPEANKSNHWKKGGAPMYYFLKLGDFDLHIGSVVHKDRSSGGGDSHGCLRQIDIDAIVMYFWAEIGTTVQIIL